VAFESAADDLVATDSNVGIDVFVRDLHSGTTTLVSTNKDGTDSGSRYSLNPAISADGRVVAFTSPAGDLVARDSNDMHDIFAFEIPETSLDCNCADPSAIRGGSGRDFLYGTEQSDIICGFGDEDFIAGQGGDDCIDGGSGDDWIYGGRGDDQIFGRAGKDVIYGHSGNDKISGDDDEDYLFDGSSDDRLDGGEGNDWLFGGGGTDECIGENTGGCEN
jgi:Ca2+-binding RTX toxin-like protein